MQHSSNPFFKKDKCAFTFIKIIPAEEKQQKNPSQKNLS